MRAAPQLTSPQEDKVYPPWRIDRELDTNEPQTYADNRGFASDRSRAALLR